MRTRGYGRSGYVAIAIVGALGFAWMGCATRTELATAPEALGKSGASPFSNSKSVTSSNDYCVPFMAFDFRNFGNPTRIDNPIRLVRKRQEPGGDVTSQVRIVSARESDGSQKSSERMGRAG